MSQIPQNKKEQTRGCEDKIFAGGAYCQLVYLIRTGLYFRSNTIAQLHIPVDIFKRIKLYLWFSLSILQES